MIVKVYRKSVPTQVSAYGSYPSYPLGTLTYDTDQRRVIRHTPEGDLIDNVEAGWRCFSDFNRWYNELLEIWSLKPEDAYWVKNDYWIDAGL